MRRCKLQPTNRHRLKIGLSGNFIKCIDIEQVSDAVIDNAAFLLRVKCTPG